MYRQNESKTEQQLSEMQCTKTSSTNETLQCKERERRKHQEQTNKQENHMPEQQFAVY